MPTSIQQTKANGIRFEVSLVGDGSADDPYRPAIFDAHPDAYYHLESTDRDSMTCVVWINKARSPDVAAEDIRNEHAPLGTVLRETSE